MIQLEHLTPDTLVNGILPDQAVKILSVTPKGSHAVAVVYRRAEGSLGETLLYRENEPSLSLVQAETRWAFDVDGTTYQLVSEAYRIHLAHLFDPVLAVHTSLIEPLPHQILAVYDEMLTRQPLRFLLADDPGAGKTVMAGLLIRELMLRGDVRRCLVCAPGSLTDQWQDELYKKFHLDFDILTRDMVEASRTGNPLAERDLLIVRLDQLSRNDDLLSRLKQTDWDLIICDEAHKMSASFSGNDVKKTRRYQLAEVFREVTRHLLLMTATPHNGKEEDFQLFLGLLDEDRFEGHFRDGVHRVDVSDLMRRMVKEKLLKFDGTPLFPERRAYTVNYSLSADETALYEDVTEYVQREFNRADQLEHDGRKGTVGFAMTILQRRLASSSEAIYQSLKRRRERLEKRLQESKVSRQTILTDGLLPNESEDWDLLDDFPADEQETKEAEVVDLATAARTVEELEQEIKSLRDLEEQALRVKRNRQDRKWNELSQLLQDTPEMKNPDGTRRKLVIFTEHRDTLNYLLDRLSVLLGRAESIVTIHGGVNREQRREIEERFRNDPHTLILLATDAAGEGINLQRAHLMVNYDLPWNPNRLEQRFGRIHRIGQTEVCHLWNLVAGETREGAVYQRLLRKLETERNALDGQVFDVLGKLFLETPLRELLVEAVRYGDQPDVKERLFKELDNLTDRERVRDLLEHQSLITHSMDVSQIMRIRQDMERASARRLQPFYIKSFFIGAFEALSGKKIHERESGRYTISYVPATIRNYAKTNGLGVVAEKYERICFDKTLIQQVGKSPAVFVCPGHPLLDATLGLLLQTERNTLQRGGVFVDESDLGTQIRALFYLEATIQDALSSRKGEQRAVSREVHFVEVREDGTVKEAGGAPYLDYRAIREDETNKVNLSPVVSRSMEWETLATDHAISELIPHHLERVRARRLELLNKTEAAVRERLTKEINYWDAQANKWQEKENEGKTNARKNSQDAKRRADNLQERLKQRQEQIAYERQLSATPPIVVGGALIIPLGLLSQTVTVEQQDKRVIEQLAMQAVMEHERQQGYHPINVSHRNLGYDIESQDGQSGRLRFIEVKGRRADATTVSLTYNELLCALNSPDQFILAVVLVEGTTARPPHYVQNYPFKEPDRATVSVTFDLSELMLY